MAELSTLQKAYREFFRALMDEYGISSPVQLKTAEKRKEFFNRIKNEWPAVKRSLKEHYLRLQIRALIEEELNKSRLDEKRINVTFTTDGERKALLTVLKKDKNADVTELDGEFVIDVYKDYPKLIKNLELVKKRLASKHRGQSGIDIHESINEAKKWTEFGNLDLQDEFYFDPKDDEIWVKNSTKTAKMKKSGRKFNVHPKEKVYVKEVLNVV